MTNLHSDSIKMVVEQKGETHNDTEVGQDLVCAACELTVAWMRTEMMQKKTQGRVIEYVNKVLSLIPMLPLPPISTYRNFCFRLTN